MIQHVFIVGFSAAYWSLILTRKSGPYRCFAQLRELAEKVPGLRNLLGEESMCETCCAFWLSATLSAVYYGLCGQTPDFMFCVLTGASAGFATWLMPTMSAQVGYGAK